MSRQPIVGLVDDDPDMLKALRRLLMARGFLVRSYSSPTVFLMELDGLQLDAVILDLSMPELNGLELQDRMMADGLSLPIIFLTGRGDIPSSVRAIKSGAVNFLTKPVDDLDLLAALDQALAITVRRRAEADGLTEERARLEKLTPREFEVFRHVITGRLNKQIASDLGASEQTIKVHRMRLTEKLGCPSVAELVRLAQRLGVAAAE
jgi:FixJ family two-component response regulator